MSASNVEPAAPATTQPETDEPQIVVREIRLTSAEEQRLLALFDKFEQESLDNLEKAAQAADPMVTALLTVIFGILALGGKEAAPALAQPLPLALAAAAIVLLLVTLIAALDAILPGAYRVRERSLSDRQAAYAAMLQRKSDGVRAAAICFGCALGAFTGLIGSLLYIRWLGF